MRTLLHDFLLPYFEFARATAYALVENLQALGVETYWVGHYIAPTFVHNFYTVVLMLSMLPLAILNVIAVRLHSRKWWLLVAALWLSPGVLCIFGKDVAPPMQGYVFTAGPEFATGDVLGTGCCVAFAVVLGWTLFMLVMGLLKTGTRFRVAFDHVWFLTGLVAAVFFVTASAATGDRDDYAQANRDVDGALAFFDVQLTNLVRVCAGPDGPKLDVDICRLARGGQYTVRDWRYMDPVVRAAFPSPTLPVMFGYPVSKSDDGVLAASILQTVDEENATLCTAGSWYKGCDYLEPSLNQFPAYLNAPSGTIVTDYVYALDLRELFPMLSRQWAESAKAEHGIEKSQKWVHLNWLYFILFAFVTGGRIALASRMLLLNEPAGFATRDFRPAWHWARATVLRTVRWLVSTWRGVRRFAANRRRKPPEVETNTSADEPI